MDSISYEKMELVHNWVSRREQMSEDLESSDWMAVDPPLGSIAPLGPLIDDIEALGTGNLCFSFRKSLLTAIF